MQGLVQRIAPAPRSLCCALVLALFAALLPAWAALAAGDSADFPLPDGHFYAQGNGQGGGPGQPGFAVTDAGGVPFWRAFSGQGGVATFGYPISTRYSADVMTDQATQRAILQWDGQTVSERNVLDLLHAAGKDAELQARYFTPPPADAAPDAGLAWDAVQARHLAFLDGDPALRAAYFAAADPLALYGLPMSLPTPEANGAVVVVRCQRAVLQRWLTAQPWAAAGQVTVANAGDIAKAMGVIPATALTPQPAPTPDSQAPFAEAQGTSDNWSGYVAALDLANGAPGSVTSVAGEWVVPAVDCARTPDAAMGVWVGMDGVYNATIEQVGTAARCVGGLPAYYAWLEVYPAAAETLSLAIQPGDTVQAEVRYQGGDKYQLLLRDVGTGGVVSVPRQAQGSRASAEWIVESMPRDGQMTPLADFGHVAFTSATATINGKTGALNRGPWAAGRLTMADAAGAPRATPSALAGASPGFSVAWLAP